MGYLEQGKVEAYFIRMTEDIMVESERLISIGRRTKSRRVKRKLAKRIDSLVRVDTNA